MHLGKYLVFSILFFFGFFSACTPNFPIEAENNSSALMIISQMEADLSELEVQMIHLREHFDFLLSNRDSLMKSADRSKYKFKNGYSTNNPQDNQSLSTIAIFKDHYDTKELMDQVYLSNGMDSVFRKVYKSSGMISQVYFNTTLQVSRVYPSYDASMLLDREIDLTKYNFFYEGDLAHNPEKGVKWIPNVYVDPAGRGWILSLVQPIYDGDELFAVMGIDVTVNEIIGRYILNETEDMLITTSDGTVVGGKPDAIEGLSLPPMRNHVYMETIRSDKFRIEDSNLFQSKNREVREMAEAILSKGKNSFTFQNEFSPHKADAFKIKKFDWYLLKIKGQRK